MRLCMNCIKFLILLKVLVKLQQQTRKDKCFNLPGKDETVRNINFIENYEVTCTFIYVCLIFSPSEFENPLRNV